MRIRTVLAGLLFAAMAASTCVAQDFSISVSPDRQTISVGESATFNVHVEAQGGLESTIFLATKGKLRIDLSDNALNPPYGDVHFSYKALAADTGTNIITVFGISGTIEHEVLCTLSVTPNDKWSRVPNPKSRLSHQLPELQLDYRSRVSMIESASIRPDGLNDIDAFYLWHYDQRHWSADTVVPPVQLWSAHNGIVCQGVDNMSGMYWILIPGGVVECNTSTFNYYRNYETTLGMDSIIAVFRARDGNVSFVGFDDSLKQQLHIAHQVGKQYTHYHCALPVDQVHHYYGSWQGKVCLDSAGGMWFGTTNVGAVCIHEDGTTQQYSVENSGMRSNDVRAIACDANGRMSFMHPYSSSLPILCSRVLGTTWDIIASPYFNNSFQPNSLMVDADHSTWASSYLGFHHIVGTSSYSNFTSANSPLDANSVLLCTHDADGNFWMIANPYPTFDFFTVYNPNGLVGIPLLQPTAVLESEVVSGSPSPFPNPASECTSIQTLDKCGSIVRLFSADGRMVRTATCDDNGRYLIPTDMLDNGVYYCQRASGTSMLVVLH